MASTRPQRDDARQGMLTVEDLTVEELAAGLRAWARGVDRLEAAVDLIITTGTWLHRSDFRAHALLYTSEVPELVWINFEAAARVADSSPVAATDTALLHIAVALAGHETCGSFGILVNGLDRASTTTVLNAIAHSAGWHRTGQCAHVTGRLPPTRTQS